MSAWEDRVAALWAAFDDYSAADFVAKMEELAAERLDDDAVALYELGGAHDSTGDEVAAAEFYERAFAAGLPDELRRPATIQYASTLRNLGRAAEAVTLLEAEMAAASDDLDDAVSATLALALTDAGREREAVGHALGALAPHLTRYNRSMANYARILREG
ncbi:tetratricopeptide repeat protein [Actinomadura rupiterrae]|uniref:tetratricopeptide repeat protein n=1 Tax=Actinomadura rupiterrae TaxID=559627 RepID=UPI0020A498DF|nr:tetratricopeptide repeat protein [Actinomadura rupiterrae]MCP2336114.1 tetratricopeptide (TPR) repeat protein [Actinomadura rupiterrae]